MTEKKTPIKQMTIKMTTLETIRKQECSLPTYGAVLDLLREALEKNSPIIFVEEERTGRRYELTKHGLVETLPGTA